MENRWSDEAARELISRHGPTFGEELASRTYSSRLIGSEPSLVLHGGGNTSLKGSLKNVLGDTVEALFIKASGEDLATIEPQGHVAVDLHFLHALLALEELGDEEMVRALRTHLFDDRAPTPSIETLVHAAIPARYVDHSHSDAILALSNQPDGEDRVRGALGESVIVLPYVAPGFELAKAVLAALEERPDAEGMVWMKHGLTTWGNDARESYDRTIDFVSRAEKHLLSSPATRLRSSTSAATAEGRLGRIAPIVRGLLAEASGDPDRPHRRVILQSLTDEQTLAFLETAEAADLAVSPPLTADHLIRTKPLPLWIEAPRYDDEDGLRGQLEEAVAGYATSYQSYVERHAARMPEGVKAFDDLPRVVLMPGLGALCAGWDHHSAEIARDITRQTLAAKARIAAAGGSYEGLAEEHLFDMEYRSLQHAKLASMSRPPFAGRVALVTGAAGAIGSAICERLLAEGAAVAATDLAGPSLDALVTDLEGSHPGRILGVALDVTDPASVSAGFAATARTWGGVDIVVINAGLAHVASLEELDVESYRRLQSVNTEGALLLLAESSRHMRLQRTGGDIVFVSTKNVASPSARFGAYSATKAAAHQLARIASLEFAEWDIRVNIVAPDAIFSHGERRSGLWEEVGPDRMQARGLDPEGLEQYYRKRNLLHVRVTAEHVANGIVFFVSRQTPTTGATLPIDGGLPDATPR